MRSVVLGGLGFLGAAVVDELIQRGDEVVVADPFGDQGAADGRFGAGRVRFVRGDIVDPRSLVAAFAGADEVYHFAGRLGTSELEDDIPGAIASNIGGAVAVFESALAASVRTVVYPSKPNVWLNTYTITKTAAEDFARLYAADRGLDVRILRYFNAYGPRQAVGPVRKIVPTFVLQALRGEPLTVYGDGEQTVDMIYSRDIGRITVAYARAPRPDGIADCGRGVALRVNEVAEAVNTLLHNPAGTRHVPMRRGEPLGTTLVADTRPLLRAIGRYAFADWYDSLRGTIAWYADRFPRGTTVPAGAV